MKYLWSALAAILLAQPTYATRYYLSMHGNDSWDGKSMETPWRTLDKLGKEMIHMVKGDSVLLARESVFDGSIDVSVSGIYLGDFGKGRKPVIRGSIELRNWKKSGTNIWVADCESEVHNLFLNGQLQSLGRYPNEGYLPIDSTSAPRAVRIHSRAEFKDGYWNTGELVVKSSRWTLDNIPIAKFENGTFYSDVTPSYPLQAGYGYFVQRHLSTLDQEGEWYFNKKTKEVFIYSSSADGPASQVVEVSVGQTGMGITSQKAVIVENIMLKAFQTGVKISESENLKLLNLEISKSGANGLEVDDCRHIVFSGGVIDGSNNNGVQWNNTTDGIFSYNSICDTGIVPGRGKSGDGNYIGLYITSVAGVAGPNSFLHNTVEHTGYSAIDFRTSETVIMKNTVRDFCSVKDDGGGIYTWRNTLGGNRIEGNTIMMGVGTGEGTNQAEQKLASGIYIDDYSSHILVKDNLISDCALSGIYLHNSNRITLVGNEATANGNSLANKENGQLYIRIDSLALSGMDSGIETHDNRWVASHAGTYCVFLSASKPDDLKTLGVFRDNSFSAQQPSQSIARLDTYQGLCIAQDEFSLSEWQSSTSYEGKSVFIPIPTNATGYGRNLIANGSITRSTDGWNVWPAGSSLSQDRLVPLTGPSLKVEVLPSNNEALVYHEGFALDRGKVYCLSFTVKSAGPGKVEFVPLEASAPWSALGSYMCFSTTSTPKTFTYLFTPQRSHANARINFKSNKTFWIDSVTLNEVPFPTRP